MNTRDRPSNVAGSLRAGRYEYIDFPGAVPQVVEITYEMGLPVCRFVDVEPEDREIELDPRDFAGEFRRIE